MKKWETLENFFAVDDTTPVKEKVHEFIKNFPQIKYLIFCGEKGSGKSHLVKYISDSLGTKYKINTVIPGRKFTCEGDLFIFDNINFFPEETQEQLKEVMKKRTNNMIITYRGRCEDRIIDELRKLGDDEGDYFYLPSPPYEVKKAIVERFSHLADIPLSEETTELILNSLEWPQPLRIIEMIKQHGTLSNEEISEDDILLLMRKFQKS